MSSAIVMRRSLPIVGTVGECSVGSGNSERGVCAISFVCDAANKHFLRQFICCTTVSPFFRTQLKISRSGKSIQLSLAFRAEEGRPERLTHARKRRADTWPKRATGGNHPHPIRRERFRVFRRLSGLRESPAGAAQDSAAWSLVCLFSLWHALMENERIYAVL
jgi:hypothetical protein